MQSVGEALVKGLVMFLGIITLAFLIALLVAWPLKLAVNWLFAPSFLLTVFGVAKLSFWQTFVLSFVTSSLFKSTSSTSGGNKK